jgi:uncharacterized protein YjaG (DUF416 family)
MAAFAAACAERLFPLYQVYNRKTLQGNPAALRRALDLLWKALGGEESAADVRSLEEAAECCEKLSPEEDAEWTTLTPIAQDAATAVVNAIGSFLKDEPRMAAGAAYCAYEAADYAVQSKLPDYIDSGTHEIVQRELAVQAEDLRELEAHSKTPAARLVELLKMRANQKSASPPNEFLAL